MPSWLADKPDYSYLRRLFKDLALRNELEYDGIFDWRIIDDDAPAAATGPGAFRCAALALDGGSALRSPRRSIKVQFTTISRLHSPRHKQTVPPSVSMDPEEMAVETTTI